MSLTTSRTDSTSALRAGVVPGRRIFVDGSSGVGSDTYDGSKKFPYATIGRGVQDLRSGEGDALLIGTRGPTTPYNETVSFTNLVDIGIFGRGKPWIGDDTTFGALTANTLMTISGADVQVTSTAHGFSVGDGVLLLGVTQAGGNYLNGAHVVSAVVDADNYKIRVASAAGSAPFSTAGPWGFTNPLQVSISQCSNVVVQGLFLDTGLLTDRWAGMVLSTVGPNPAGGNFFVSGCVFGKACVGINASAAPLVTGTGTRNLIERNLFSPTISTTIHPVVAPAASLVYLNGGSDIAVLENNFASVSASPASTWVPSNGIIVHQGIDPGQGHLISGNLFPAASGSVGIQRDRLFHSFKVAQEAGSPPIFAKRNFFSGVSTIQDVAMDNEGYLVDTEPQTIVKQEAISTQSDLIWERNAAGAAAVAGTIGRVVADSLYEGGVFVDTVNGTSGQQVRGVNGTRVNPVATETDARALADALGIKEYTIINGSLTLTQAHQNWFFRGIGPESATLEVGGQDIDGSGIERLTVSGTIGGAASNMLDGKELIFDNATGLKGTMVRALFTGTCAMAGNGSLLQVETALSPGIIGVVMDIGGDGRTFIAKNVAGTWALTNIDSGAPASVVGLHLDGATIVLDASSVGGVLNISGIHGVPLALNGALLGLLQDDTIPGAIFEEATSDHNTAGSFGAEIQAKAAPGAAMDLVTDAVDANAVAATGASEIRDAILSDATPFAGANIDVAISTRAAPGAAMDLVPARISELTRMHGENARTQLSFADAAISGGRVVPAGAVSHLRVQIRAEGAVDWSAPTEDYFVVFSYKAGAGAADPTGSSTVQTTAPVDGTFTTVGFPA